MIFVAFFSVQAIRGAEGHKDNAVTLILFCFFCSREGLALGRQAGRWAGGRVIYRCRRPPDGKIERIRRKEYVVPHAILTLFFFGKWAWI